MESSCKKSYDFNEAEAKSQYETYFSPHVPYSVYRETTINMIRAIYKAFSTGKVTGKIAIDVSIGPIIVSLIAMKDFIEEITVLELNEVCLNQTEKWKNKEPDAFDWSHTIDVLKAVKGNSDGQEDEEEDLRGKMKSILKYDLSKDNPDSLQLPKADIVTSIWSLETMSKDHEDCRRNLRKFSNLIKLGGYFLLYAITNSSYFTVADRKIPFLSCDESFYRNVISEKGFEIKHFEYFERGMTIDNVDHDGHVFIVAQKVKEP